jgi:uncharacterized protein (UPF0297 family)
MLNIDSNVNSLHIAKCYAEKEVQTLVVECEPKDFDCISIERVLVLVYDTCEQITYIAPIRETFEYKDISQKEDNQYITIPDVTNNPIQQVENNEVIEESINETLNVNEEVKTKVVKKKSKLHLSKSFRRQQLVLEMSSQKMLVRE